MSKKPFHLLAASLVLFSSSTSAARADQTDAAASSDEQAIRTQAADYARAFAAADAKTLAEMWTPDGTFTDSKGREHIGRAAIESFFHEGFASGAQTLDVAVQSVKFPAANVAIEEGTTRIASGPGMGSMGRYLVVHTKQDGKWLMQTASETDCRAQTSYEYLKDLNWLVGNWYIKDQPQGAHLKVDWSKNKTFLVMRYVGSQAQDSAIEELQIIGWDPHGEDIVTWHFGARGGFGCGKLWYDGKSWMEKASTTEPSGNTGQAQYKLTQLDNNNFSWQTSGRTIAGTRLPDSKELLITRDTTP